MEQVPKLRDYTVYYYYPQFKYHYGASTETSGRDISNN